MEARGTLGKDRYPKAAATGDVEFHSALPQAGAKTEGRSDKNKCMFLSASLTVRAVGVPSTSVILSLPKDHAVGPGCLLLGCALAFGRAEF
ncbi:MAG: hypothetical protein DMG61_12160 [Acidobacteria bacterium]|nr:MAG: hypothetical protein DMG61_12160 [Acidobacteriota bacterium]